MPRVFAKPTPKIKSQTAEAKPAEVKKEPDSKREPAAEAKAPETPPQADQPGSSSAGPSDDVTYQQTEAAYDFGALLDRDDKLQKVAYLFLTRVYSVFRPEKLPQVGELLAKYDLKLKTLVGAVAAKYLTKDSAENLLKDLVRVSPKAPIRSWAGARSLRRPTGPWTRPLATWTSTTRTRQRR